MVKQDPRAAATMARDYVGDIFNQAVGDLKSGPDQYGGAGFRTALVGDPASARNIQAVVTQLPQGQQRWAGFKRFLDVMEATGWKPAKGSDTAFNSQSPCRELGRSSAYRPRPACPTTSGRIAQKWSAAMSSSRDGASWPLLRFGSAEYDSPCQNSQETGRRPSLQARPERQPCWAAKGITEQGDPCPGRPAGR
jgi:hypothetical protein